MGSNQLRRLLILALLIARCFAQSTSQGTFTTSGQFTQSAFAGAAPTAPVVQTTSVPSGTQGIVFTPVQFAATGGTPCTGSSGPYTWTETGALPANTSFTSGGKFSGTPGFAGTFPITVFAKDCGSPQLTSAGQAITIVIAPPPPNDPTVEDLYTALGDVVNFGGTVGPVTLPTAGVYTSLNGTPSGGSTCAATDNASMNACLAGANPGDVITACGSFTGTFTLPVKANDATHWITIRTCNYSDPNFPAEHVRATPAQINQSSVPFYPSYTATAASLMPTFTVTATNGKVFVPAAGAHHYRITGLNITKAAGVVVDNALIDMSAGADHIIIDRNLIHGVPMSCNITTGVSYTCNHADELKQGVNLNNCTYCAVINNWIYDVICYSAQSGCDAVGIAWGTGGSTTGPIKVYNNQISSSGEAYLVGGGGGTAGFDCEIRHNHFFKPVSWFLRTGASGDHPIIKNNGEFKNQHRCKVEGNEYENSIESWQGDQFGFHTLITPKNQGVVTQGTADSDGAGNLTAKTSNFGNTTAAGCSKDRKIKISRMLRRLSRNVM